MKRRVHLATEVADAAATSINTQERLRNLYIQPTGEVDYNGRAIVSAVGTPQAERYVGNLRALRVLQFRNKILVVAADGLYEIKHGRIATKPLKFNEGVSSAVQVAKGPHHIVITDGDNGGWWYNGEESGRIDFGQYTSAHSVVYADGYFVFANEDVFFTSQVFTPSVLYELDFARPVGDIGSIKALEYINRELIICTDRTMDFWGLRGTVSPDNPFPFLPSNAYALEYGGVHNTLQVLANTLFWLSDNGEVYTLRGHEPVRVSNSAVEEWVAGKDLRSWAYIREGHACYALQGLNEALVWDAGRWHYRDGDLEDVQTVGAELLACNYDGLNKLVPGRAVREMTLPPIASGRNEYFPVNRFELDVLAAGGNAWMQYSKDSGSTWSDWMPAEIPREHGARVPWRSLGRCRHITFRIRIEADGPVEIVGAWVDAA